tara:strand:- start:11973 stop:13604 length:1632 start_codon:yes stop_codon:yes gene_type:complete
MVEEKRPSLFQRLTRRTTPKPQDRTIYNPGIQEKDTSYLITAPIIYHVTYQSVIARTCITQLKNEIFRRGYVWEEKFTARCGDCAKEHKQAVTECVECGSTNLVKPDRNQLKYIKKLLDGYVNKGEQMFVDVLKEMEDDLNIMDDAYLIMVKEYYVDGNGDIRMHRIKEVYRGDPVSMHIYADENGERGSEGFTCLNHRNFISKSMTDSCEMCGSELHPVHYVNRANGKEQYFIDGEVLHFSKYAPSRLYGQSPIMTLWNHITTLIAMENYVNSSYTKARMPRGILAVQTRNMESMKSFWRGVKEKMEQDPHFIPVMGIEGEGKTGAVEWVKFMDSLKEMDYIQVKEDLRDRIAAFYGVSKIFMADNSASGGLNNEGMQILVTNRAVEMAQTIWNEYVFPFMTMEFGITDWQLKLPPSEEEDEIAKLRKREIEVNVAASIKNLGFEVDMDDEGRFTFKKPDPKPEAPPQEGAEEEVETDPYAGTDIDASQLGQLQEQALMGGQGGGETRNKPSMETGPDKRFTGLPQEAGNQNVDSRTERRVG